MTKPTAAAALLAALAITPAAQADTPLPLPPLPGEAYEAPALRASPIATAAEAGVSWGEVQQTGYRLGVNYGLPAAPQDPQAAPTVPIPGYGNVTPTNTRRPIAPLYPAPVQYTPPRNGGAIITNQALAPHEMLYPHEYDAMYGPYYYTVKGGFIWTPLGVRTHEKWELQGTRVNVKYHDRIKLFSGYKPVNLNFGIPSL